MGYTFGRKSVGGLGCNLDVHLNYPNAPLENCFDRIGPVKEVVVAREASILHGLYLFHTAISPPPVALGGRIACYHLILTPTTTT